MGKEEIEELRRTVEAFERMMPERVCRPVDEIVDCASNEEELIAGFTHAITEFEEDRLEIIRKIREVGFVDESVISLMRRPTSTEGLILPEERFEISDKKTGNKVATVKALEIFTHKQKNRNRAWISGQIITHNNGDDSKKNRNKTKIFKGSEIKITKSH